MTAAREFGAVLLVLALFVGLGWPAATLVPVRRRLDALGAAPVLGYGWFGVAATLLYRAGLPPWSGLVVAVPASLLGWANLLRELRRPADEARRALLPGLGLLGVVVLLLLPAWRGGLQFALFQGNEWDESNYVGAAVAYETHSYAELDPSAPVDPASPPPALRTGFGDFGRSNLNSRPTVAIAYAAVGPVLPGLLCTGSYVYRALVLSLWFAAAAFGLCAVLRAGPALTVLLAAALSVGFFGQYVIDINAWSELAGVPLALTAVAALATLLFPSSADPPPPRAAAALVMAVATPAAFFYPEVLPPYGAAALLLLGLAACWRGRRAFGRPLCAGLCGGLVAALLWCALYWQGTLGFLYRQITSREFARPDWYLYFQRYLWGLDAAEWRGASGTWTAYGLLSAPVDFLSGAFGVYFAVPPPSWPLALRAAAKGALAVFLVALLYEATLSVVAVLREPRRGRAAFLLACLGGCALPIVLALLDRPWQAGKLLSMVTPLLFLGLAFPLVARGRLVVGTAPALVLVLAHLAFGVYRPIAAGSAEDGIHYRWPYPAVAQPELKKGVDWDLRRWQQSLSSCRLVNLNVQHALVHAYAEVLLCEAGIPWAPSRPTVSYDRERIVAPEDAEHSATADCQLLDSLRRRDRREGGSHFLYVGRGRARQVPASRLDALQPPSVAKSR